MREESHELKSLSLCHQTDDLLVPNHQIDMYPLLYRMHTYIHQTLCSMAPPPRTTFGAVDSAFDF